MTVGNPLDPAKTINSFHLCNLCSARYYYAGEGDVTQHSTKTESNNSDQKTEIEHFMFFASFYVILEVHIKTFDKVGSFFFLLNLT